MGLPYLLIAGSIATALIAVVYAFAVHYIPFIYIDGLCTVGAGLGIGYALGWAAKQGHVRNLPLMLLAGVVFGVLADYLAWIVNIWILTDYEVVLTSPTEILGVIQIIGEDGLWTIRSLTPTGWVLWSFWIAELLIIVGFAAWYARDKIATVAYCEETHSWADQQQVWGPFAQVSAAQAKAQILKGDYSPFLELQKVAGSAAFSQVTMCSSKKNPDFVTLTLENVTITQEKKKEKTERKVVVRNVVSTPELNQMLLAHWNRPVAAASAGA